MGALRSVFPSLLAATLALPALAQTTSIMQNRAGGYSGTDDARVTCCATANTNEGGAEVVDLIPDDTTALLIRFAILQSEGGLVPSGASIQSATLSIYHNFGPGAVFKLDRVTKPWVESGVTWMSTGTTAWSTPGVFGTDLDTATEVRANAGDSTALGCPVIGPAPDACWLRLDVTSFVQTIASGGANDGWKLAYVSDLDGTQTSSHTPKEFFSSENTRDETLHPMLTVTWTAPAGSASVPLYMMYRASNTDWLYTTDASEKASALGSGFADGGTAGFCDPVDNGAGAPLYRFWKGPPQNEHFYTTDPNEKNTVVSQGYFYEGIQCWVWPTQVPGTTAFYRMTKFDGATGDLVHFYTTDTNAVTQKQGEGYTLEGIQAYIKPPSPQDLPPGGRAVETFNSMSLYWDPPAGANIVNGEVSVRYRLSSADPNAPGFQWSQGHPLWYDPNPPPGLEHARGSVVHLQPGTAYTFELGTGDPANPVWTNSVTGTTWSESFPGTPAAGMWSGDNQTLVNAGAAPRRAVLYVAPGQGGSPGNYAIYDFGNAASATVTVTDGNVFGVVISANYVVLKNFRVTGGASGIYIDNGVHDVIIDNVEITGYGAGSNDDGGVKISRFNDWSTATRRIVVQNCRIHNPAFGAVSWDVAHPNNTSGVVVYPTGGQLVIRNNAVWSTQDGTMGGLRDLAHFHQDGLVSGGENGVGLGPDVDIYRNIVMDYFDDGLETDGDGINNRVWANYFDYGGASAVSSTGVLHGPTYIWRNVYNRQRQFMNQTWGSDPNGRNYMMKAGGLGGNGGRRYIFNNTSMQPPVSSEPDASGTLPLGAGFGIGGTGGTGNEIENTVSRNNVFEMFRNDHGVFDFGGLPPDPGSDMDFDVTNGNMTNEANGVANAVINYAAGNGWSAYWTGNYRISSITKNGVTIPNVSQPIPNFNPNPNAPYGAQEGTAPMQIGPGAGGN